MGKDLQDVQKVFRYSPFVLEEKPKNWGRGGVLGGGGVQKVRGKKQWAQKKNEKYEKRRKLSHPRRNIIQNRGIPKKGKKKQVSKRRQEKNQNWRKGTKKN